MAESLRFFMTAEDERAFLRWVARFELEVYPLRIPPGWGPFLANEDAHSRLPENSLYLAAVKVAPLTVDRIKRGPTKGHWHVDEVRSPVIYFERSKLNEEGELVAGQLWAEPTLTPQTGRRDPAPEHFRRLVMEIHTWIRKTYKKSEPKGFLIGPSAAREMRGGLVLRDSAFKGRIVRGYR